MPPFFSPDDENPGHWKSLTPEEFEEKAEQLERCYRVQWDVDGVWPIFQHPHGVQLIDWQLKLWQATQAVCVVPGGFGSSKTWGKLLCMLTNAVMLPGYRGFILAPYSVQSSEAYKQALQIIQGTKFERFVLRTPTRPYPHLVLGNDVVGRNTIECYSVLDDPGKILTLSGDEAMVDQAEQIPDLDELVRNAGSRLRGQIRGRPRKGQVTLLANSADNPMLWDWVDMADEDPEYVWSYSPGTYENPYLTIADLQRFERQVGRDDESRRVHLEGGRPKGSGEHFPEASLVACHAKYLDERMDEAINAGKEGYIREEAKRVSVHRWEMPPEEDRMYIVAADPGWGDPPMRNAAAIGVWDISNFPETPAVMVAFSWVFGGGSPNPWMNMFTYYVMRYRAIGNCGIDGTGFQSGYEKMTDLEDLLMTLVSLAGAKKYAYLNLTKKIMADGMFQVPNIPHLFSQCSKYKLPDNNLRQDIVMMLLVTAALLEPYYYFDLDEPEERTDGYDPTDRYWRSDEDRYGDRFMEREVR
jgi:hypothetical protein